LAEAAEHHAPIDASQTRVVASGAEAATMTSGPLTTSLGVVMGTAAYMSPEQARGLAVDRRTDVWAFGALLYEMLAGKRAFHGGDVTETIAAVLRSTPDWNALPPHVPPHIVGLIQRCLEVDRAARIDDMSVVRFLLAPPAASPAAAGERGTAAPRSG